MRVLFTIAMVLWMLSIHFYLPLGVIFSLFAAMMFFATVGVMKWWEDSRGNA